ncbi:DNA recombination protein RmuC [Tomitella fengzijianii]|uniref:DNA recombination protein RmuC n=1 Tax=Tomitella fengzijianii TaxID=2597660 RepID=A0A516X7T7_9ACTN|nr:DNA recombination protein RmuC [Tomitella fengzijianii]QDQ99127.1 DNA recombination protein RmuC [Tomitella fengzijianii]
MDGITAVMLVAALVLGAVVGWLAHAARVGDRLARAEATMDAREEGRQTWEASLGSVNDAAARRNAGEVGERMGQVVAPLRDALGALSEQLRLLEHDRVGAYAGISEQVAAMHHSNRELSTQTTQLVSALRAPQVRGRWGELQLERVVELAGMARHCDFDTQVTAESATDGPAARVRPDMIIRLSGGRRIVVDAKVPLSAYLDALSATREQERQKLMFSHASQLRAHVDKLAAKAYWRAFDPTPEFVVLFVPGDPFLDAAVSTDKGLFEYAMAKNVVLATPTTLVALLRTVALGWRHEALSQEAQTIHTLGTELARRLETMSQHFDRVGDRLGKAVESFNATAASYESRVMVTARRLSELQMTDANLPPIRQVESVPRVVAWTDTPTRGGAADGAVGG